MFLRFLDRLCWWRQRPRGRKRRRRRSSLSSGGDSVGATSRGTSPRAAGQPAKIIRIDAATEVEPRRTLDSGCQTDMERKAARRREENGEGDSRSSSGSKQLSWLDYPWLSDRRSLQYLQCSQVGHLQPMAFCAQF